MHVLFSLIIIFFSFNAWSFKLQILHTNDLHSYLESSGDHPNKGGYPALKYWIDYYKNKASKDGLNTLVLDAGDFLEGNMYYKARNGEVALSALSKMGYDAVVLGNHDYLMGTDDLDALLGKVNPSFNLLCANLGVDKRFNNINRQINPYAEFNLDGKKIAILGLTTDSKLYSWRINDGVITEPIKKGIEVSEFLKKVKKNDFVIALTHIGFASDQILAKTSSSIDLIVGGHSHTRLDKPYWLKNFKGIHVPIVQTGEHGLKLGKMILEIEKGKEVKLIDYELIDVNNNFRNHEMVKFVEDGNIAIENQYGRDYLKAELGFSKVPLTHSKTGRTFWGDFIADSIRESVNAEIGIHTVAFAGFDQPAGPIRMETVMNSYPRFFELDHEKGWNVYKAEVSGAFLQFALAVVAITGAPLNISGAKLEWKMDANKPIFSMVSVRGKPIKLTKKYTIALPEGVARGGPFVTRFYHNLFSKTEETNVSIWDAIKDKVKRTGTLTEQSLDPKIERMMIPEMKEKTITQVIDQIEESQKTNQ